MGYCSGWFFFVIFLSWLLEWMYIQALEDKNICQDLAALCKFFALQESTSSVNHVPVNFYFNFLINSHLIWTYLYFTDEYTTGVWVNTGFILYSTSPFSFTFICLYLYLYLYSAYTCTASAYTPFCLLIKKTIYSVICSFSAFYQRHHLCF